jgi:hypothetical protein
MLMCDDVDHHVAIGRDPLASGGVVDMGAHVPLDACKLNLYHTGLVPR